MVGTISSPASRTRSSRSIEFLTGASAKDTIAAMDDQQIAALSFEDALTRLEEIVRTLEKGEAPLDQSIALYQEGDALKRHCEARLKDAQMRIDQIALGADGKSTGTIAFDAG